MKKEYHLQRFILSCAFITSCFIFFSCSDNKAKEIYELAEFEELQMNYDHAEELYNEVIKKYPDTDLASKSAEKLPELQKKRIAVSAENTMTTPEEVRQ